MKPPAVARWLLERFASNGALVGDLLEEYQARRSPLWYWRQVLAAVIAGTLLDIRAHRWLTARAVLTGWIVALRNSSGSVYFLHLYLSY
jgi:hypothetical protein